MLFPMLKLSLALLAVAFAAPLLMTLQAQQADPLMTRALRLLKESPIVDGHNDYPWAVREKGAMDIDLFDMRQPQPKDRKSTRLNSSH